MSKKMSGRSLINFLLLFINTLILSCSISNAQDKIELIDGIRVTIKSTILNEDRVISVCLPSNYDMSSRKYPVLYLLDGNANFQHAVGAVNFLSSRGIIPQLLVVAIHNVDRNRDFLPEHGYIIPEPGQAGKFLNFISDELSRYINENYRASNFSILAGHSFGGTFAVYSLLNKPELFDAYIAISPVLHYADNYLVNRSEEMLRSDYDSQKYFYMTVGNEPDYFPALKEFSSLIKKKSGNIIDFNYTKIETESHATIPYPGVYNGLKFIFSDWQLPEAKFRQGILAIDEYYKNISAKYDLGIKTPENVLNMLGYVYLQNHDIESAIMVFTENAKRYPESPNVYDSLGEAYETNNQFEPARENYQKAYDLAGQQNHVNTPVYQQHLKRVQQK